MNDTMFLAPPSRLRSSGLSPLGGVGTSDVSITWVRVRNEEPQAQPRSLGICI